MVTLIYTDLDGNVRRVDDDNSIPTFLTYLSAQFWGVIGEDHKVIDEYSQQLESLRIDDFETEDAYQLEQNRLKHGIKYYQEHANSMLEWMSKVTNREKFEHELSIIKKIDGVANVYLSLDSTIEKWDDSVFPDVQHYISSRHQYVVVETEDLLTPPMGARFLPKKLGSFVVVLPLAHFDAYVLPLSGNYVYDSLMHFHPHISETGGPCMGNISHALPPLIESGEVAAAVQLMIEFLRNPNPYDDWGKAINLWPYIDGYMPDVCEECWRESDDCECCPNCGYYNCECCLQCGDSPCVCCPECDDYPCTCVWPWDDGVGCEFCADSGREPCDDGRGKGDYNLKCPQVSKYRYPDDEPWPFSDDRPGCEFCASSAKNANLEVSVTPCYGGLGRNHFNYYCYYSVRYSG
jgi:hypothetical protein